MEQSYSEVHPPWYVTAKQSLRRHWDILLMMLMLGTYGGYSLLTRPIAILRGVGTFYVQLLLWEIAIGSTVLIVGLCSRFRFIRNLGFFITGASVFTQACVSVGVDGLTPGDFLVFGLFMAVFIIYRGGKKRIEITKEISSLRIEAEATRREISAHWYDLNGRGSDG